MIIGTSMIDIDIDTTSQNKTDGGSEIDPIGRSFIIRFQIEQGAEEEKE